MLCTWAGHCTKFAPLTHTPQGLGDAQGLGGGLCRWGPQWDHRSGPSCHQGWHSFLPSLFRYTIFPQTAEGIFVLAQKNTSFFPFSFSTEVFFFHFWTAERHGAVTSPCSWASRSLSAGTGSPCSCHGPARRPIPSHVLQRSCQCLRATADSDAPILQML